MSDSTVNVPQPTSNAQEAPVPPSKETAVALPVIPPIVIPAIQPTPAATTAQPKTQSRIISNKLAVSTRREAIVSWWLTGNKYGNHRLMPIRFTKHSITHDAMAKLIPEMTKRGVTLDAGLNFVESQCYQLPDVPLPMSFKPDGTRKVGGGDSGAVVYHFSSINPRPGSYMLMAAAEAVITYFLEQLADLMYKKRSLTAKTQATHTLQIGYIADLLQKPKDPLLNYIAGFYGRWAVEARYHDTQTKGAKGAKPSFKRKYLPINIQFPDVKTIVSGHQRYLIDRMLATSCESRKKRGHALYERLVESGKSPLKSARAAIVKPKDESGEGKKMGAPLKSDLQKAIEADRQKKSDVQTTQKRPKPSDPGYDVTLCLSQKNLINLLLDRIPGTRALIGPISPEARRMVDDLFNELLITLTNTAISGMVLAETVTLTKDVAFAAINTFFDIIYGLSPSITRRRATGNAIAVYEAYEHFLTARREKRGAQTKPEAKPEAEVEDDEEDEEDEAELEAELSAGSTATAV